jgi:hypothetical protein
MAGTGSVTISGTISGEPTGIKQINEVIQYAAAVGSVWDGALAQGFNSIAVPAGATAAIIQPPANNATYIVLKGAANDVGTPMHMTNPQYFSMPAAIAALAAPAAPTLVAAGSGGSWAAVTGWVKITYVNQFGESLPSAVASQAVVSNGTLTINSPAASGSGAGAATGWYAYVGTGASEPADAAKYRQQGAGNPTAIGANLLISAPPTTTGANPPVTNTSGLSPSLGIWAAAALAAITEVNFI